MSTVIMDGQRVGFALPATETDNFRLDELTLEVVPEPSTFAMLLGGVGALLLRRRRA